MTILIIIVALMAIAVIFGRRAAQLIVFGSGVLFIGGIVLVVGSLLIFFLWDQMSTNITVVLGVILVSSFLALFGKKNSEAQEVPAWFGGDHRQWGSFLEWNKNALQSIRANASKTKNDTVIWNQIPPWFAGDRQQWDEFLGWYRNYVRRGRDDGPTDLPSWFGGNKQQWKECQSWYDSFDGGGIIKAPSLSRKA